MVGPAITGIFMYLMPPYGVALAVLILGESLQSYHFAGMVLVTAGVASRRCPRSSGRRWCAAPGVSIVRRMRGPD